MQTLERLLEVRVHEATWNEDGYFLVVHCCDDASQEPLSSVILRHPITLEIPEFDAREILSNSLEIELQASDAKHQVERNILIDKIQQLKALPAPENT